ncbi:hypothetical protein T265_00158 [Opisthorchis viverrini]|uniref:Uncharacterized protein n=1 Tax=Opisthorchis viverrini TaxID=6198 RepID=A0A075A4L4_OPIVI|nr:hypothetical protein T265_00158 [Opisthorchis viverrini]KER34316.1 hypothetical protein T265_00158 [Opisthorchis viverrini]
MTWQRSTRTLTRKLSRVANCGLPGCPGMHLIDVSGINENQLILKRHRAVVSDLLPSTPFKDEGKILSRWLSTLYASI